MVAQSVCMCGAAEPFSADFVCALLWCRAAVVDASVTVCGHTGQLRVFGA